jgi:hypothetical protein
MITSLPNEGQLRSLPLEVLPGDFFEVIGALDHFDRLRAQAASCLAHLIGRGGDIVPIVASAYK